MDTLLMLDFSILTFITETLQSAPMTAFMRFMSRLGDYGTIWIALTLFLLARRTTRRCGLVMAAALLFGLLCGEGVLKNLVCRPRPFLQSPDFTPLIEPPNSYSFPSGHTLSSFAAATALFCSFRRAGIGAYGIAALIALSRLYLCVHFPSDVLAGLVLGVLAGALAQYVVNRCLDRLHYRRLHR